MSDRFELTEPEDLPAPTTTTPGDASTGLAWGVIFSLVGIALVAVFILQNTDPIPVRFLWLAGDFPLSIIILVTLAASVLLTEIAAASYRRRRRRRLAEKEELRRFRAQ